MSFDKLLSEVYFDLKSPGSFGGIRKLYLEARKIEPTLTLKDVNSWVENQLTYTLHKQIRNNFKRNRILVQRKSEQFEADLVDMQMFSRANSGFKYIITVIDCFSKFLYAFPIKNKTADEIIKVFEKIFINDKPEKVRTDRGLEFDNSKVQKYFKDNDVKYFTSNDTKIKCAIVERVNRTLKSKMFRYFTSQGTRKYIDILPQLVDTYNRTYHRSIKMRPIDVSDDNRAEVFENIYKVNSFRELYNQRGNKNPKININNNVRVKYDLNKSMEKSYYPLWSDTIYQVNRIIPKDKKPNYKVSLNGQELKRSYYPEEVQKIGDDLVYRIEKVLQKRRLNGIEQVLVKYIGYSNEYNQWIPKANLINLKAGSMTARPRPRRN